MFFITNRAFVEGNASAEMRKVAFELNNNEAGQSVYFCWRDDAKKAYVELGSDNFMKAMRKAATRQVLFYLHDSAQFPEEQVFPTAEKLQALFDEQDKNLVDVVPVIWPCDNGQSPMRDFHEDQIAAEASGVAFARALEKFLVWRESVKGGEAPCLKRLNVLAHSMGNRVLRQTLSCWANYHRKGQVPLLFRNVFMLAADVFNESLEPTRDGRYICHSARNVVVYHAADDRILGAGSVGHLGANSASRRLGHTGPEHQAMTPQNVYTVDCDDVNNKYDRPNGHTYFLADEKGEPGKVFLHMYDAVKKGRIQGHDERRGLIVDLNFRSC
ncbi:Alpha/beta hydrolase of unknown function [Humidesulfovibrio mexicanus]|uniref:Alpha/beta hydrolase n=1 Tax=Humidesulfovibrio mexicanus TaxID=147047 RepID=A0A238ZEB3_9BACT|nr:alpha/beta hydrolase [Humidesulfovibrio mexicanus]SNR81845.1 Alpha/beta hydrolase of unknown function [Humidesulfovibrio mexicanus]